MPKLTKDSTLQEVVELLDKIEQDPRRRNLDGFVTLELFSDGSGSVRREDNNSIADFHSLGELNRKVAPLLPVKKCGAFYNLNLAPPNGKGYLTLACTLDENHTPKIHETQLNANGKILNFYFKGETLFEVKGVN